MKRQDAIAALKGEASAVKALGATGLYVFGSTARDNSWKNNLDLFLVDYDRDSRFSLVELVGIKQLLERRLGIPVKLHDNRDSLDPLLKNQMREFGQARLLTERPVQPALHAIREANSMTSITDLRVFDLRFPTSQSLDGSDAMNPDPDYSAAYVILDTGVRSLKGHGLTFTIGRGNEICCAAIKALRHLVVGLELE